MPRRYLLPLNVESVPLASLYPFPFLVHLGVACNGHYEAEKQPPLNTTIFSDSDLPKPYIKHPWELLSTLIRSPLLLEIFPLPNLANCSPEFMDSGGFSTTPGGDTDPAVLFLGSASRCSSPFRTRPSPKHTRLAFFLVAGDKSDVHPAMGIQPTRERHLVSGRFFSIFQYFFPISH